MINLELTPKIKEWLETPSDQRDLEAGALLLFQVTKNRILYDNVRRRISAKASAIEYHLQKIYARRAQDITHEQVAEMMAQCDDIAKAHALHLPASQKKSEFQKGKRADHDQLPESVQKLWAENGEIRQKMRDCHTRLRLIDSSNSTCPDSDRYPWAKQLIAYDKLYRDNWNRYDHYIQGTNPLETKLAEDPRTVSKNAVKLCNMLLGKYLREPDEKTATRIREAYAKVISPTPALQEKIRKAKLDK